MTTQYMERNRRKNEVEAGEATNSLRAEPVFFFIFSSFFFVNVFYLSWKDFSCHLSKIKNITLKTAAETLEKF